MKNTLVAVWGSQAAGATTFSAALSAALSAYFSKILLVSADKYSPAFAKWGIPNDDKSKRTASIAKICALPDITEDIVKRHITVCPYNEKIGLIGCLTNDDCELYEKITGNAAETFLSAAKRTSEVTVVDCTIPQHDRITEKALKEADIVIILLEPNAAGIAFVYAQNSFIAHYLADDRKYLFIAAKVTPTSAVDEFENKLGLNLDSNRLPYTFEATEKLSALKLFENYNGEYQRTVNGVAEYIKEVAQND